MTFIPVNFRLTGNTSRTQLEVRPAKTLALLGESRELAKLRLSIHLIAAKTKIVRSTLRMLRPKEQSWAVNAKRDHRIGKQFIDLWIN